jgi:glycolate oxidase FAD binding subunit
LRTVTEVAETLRAASASGERVAVADLDLSGLDAILEHEAGDLTCTVEAGIRLSVLQAALASHGQRLSLDPPGDPTIGACIGGDLAGPISHRFGRMRDLVLGVTVVLGDGLVASSGGKVVKNVAGYDLGKLFCGSRGTLGVVVCASLRLHPIPEAKATLVVPADAEEDAQAKKRVIVGSQLVPSALDVTSERLAVLFEGSHRAVEAQMGAARSLVGGDAGSEDVWEEARVRSQLEQESLDEPAAALLERIRAQLDPAGVLVSG